VATRMFTPAGTVSFHGAVIEVEFVDTSITN